MGKSKHKIIFQPMGVRAEVEDGTNLRSVARDVGVSISSICAERATCGKCRIIVQRGEFQKDGIRSTDLPRRIRPEDRSGHLSGRSGPSSQPVCQCGPVPPEAANGVVSGRSDRLRPRRECSRHPWGCFPIDRQGGLTPTPHFSFVVSRAYVFAGLLLRLPSL